MDLKIELEWLKEMDRRQGDISDPAPYWTGHDIKAIEQRKAEWEARQRNGAANGSLHLSDAEVLAQEPETKAAA